MTGTGVQVDIDLQHDGTFTDPGDQNVPTQVLWTGGPNDSVEVLSLPSLPNGTWTVQVQADNAVAQTTVGIQVISTTTPQVLFQANKGQTDPSVTYTSQTNNYTAFLTRSEAVLSLPDVGNGGSTLQMQFLPEGANSSTGGLAPVQAGSPSADSPTAAGLTIQPLQPNKAITNYLIGNNPADWVTNVPNYGAVQYNNIYPGVDVTWSGINGNLQYQFTVQPGASPAEINLGYTLGAPGESTARLLSNGDLLLVDNVTATVMVITAPTLYQVDASGNHVAVPGSYKLVGNDLTFNVGTYDPTRALVIDPALTFCTYFGGSPDAEGYAIAIDSSDNSYITGTTDSTDATNFPLTAATLPASEFGNNSAGGTGYVAKFDPNGNQIYTTFLGGSGSMANQAGDGIAVDASGNAYVTGYTDQSNFPVTGSAFQSANNGLANDETDAFLSVLNATGTGLIYSTYYGGSGGDSGDGIALQGTNAYVAGTTGSVDLPTSTGAVQPASSNDFTDGNLNGFVAAFDTTSSGANSLLYATFVGGNNDTTTTYAIAVDTGGNAYVTGTTDNTTDFPLSGGVGQTFATGNISAAYALSLNSTGSAYNWGVLISGNGDDTGNGVAIDGSDNVYVTGSTTSSSLFPISAGAYQSTYPPVGVSNTTASFVTEIAAGGSAYLYSTYLGGSNSDIAFNIAVDSAGNACIVGNATSSNFPQVNSIQPFTVGVDSYGFLSVLNATGTALTFSTLLGSTTANDDSDTVLYGVAVDSSSNVYVTGSTDAAQIPVTAGAFQTTFAGTENNALVAEFSATTVTPPPPPPPPPTTPPSNPGEISLYQDDRFESNETEDAATNFGALALGSSSQYSNLTVNIHANGLPDYDWYTWTAATSGTFTASINVTQGGTSTSTLEIHVFTVDSNNTLIEDGNQTVSVGGTGSVSVALTAGESVYVEVKGTESSPGYRDQGIYVLNAGLN